VTIALWVRDPMLNVSVTMTPPSSPLNVVVTEMGSFWGFTRASPITAESVWSKASRNRLFLVGSAGTTTSDPAHGAAKNRRIAEAPTLPVAVIDAHPWV
jgi:hypothetical protein